MEQTGLAWQAPVAPPEHAGAEVSRLPFHWRPPEASSEGRTANREEEKVLQILALAGILFPSSTAGVIFSVCYLAVLSWGKSHLENPIPGSLLLSVAFLSAILSALPALY